MLTNITEVYVVVAVTEVAVVLVMLMLMQISVRLPDNNSLSTYTFMTGIATRRTTETSTHQTPIKTL